MSHNYRTEAPFVVTTLGGALRSVHFSTKSAIQEVLSTRGYRVIYGRHRGDWKELAHFNKGVKL